MEELAGKIFARLPKLHIGVLGDFAVDAYWMLEDSVGEISVETGKRAMVVRSQRYSPGGAGNIMTNLAALGAGGLEAFGVVGEDVFGKLLIETLDKLGVTTGGMLIQSENWDTPVWAKPHLEGEEQRRLDFGFHNRIAEATRKKLFETLAARLPGLDVLIINQQLPNPLVTGKLIERLNKLTAEFNNKIFVVDCRDNIDLYRNAVLKIDQSSLNRRYRGVESLYPDEQVFDRQETATALEALFASRDKPVVLIRGRRGCMVYENGQCAEVPAVFITGPVDPVGAGDTMLAALTVALAAGAKIEEAAGFGNYAASVTVAKLRQTGTASPKEILERIGNSRLVYHPDLAEDPRKAQYLPGTGIEIVNPGIVRGRIRQMIFDHDGTVSTLREGWEPIMEEVMLKCIFGESFSTVSAAEFRLVQVRVKEFIDQSTGVQTIVQMQALADMVAEFGYVPAAEILDAKGYKTIFNVKLLEMVHGRLARLEAAELECADFTVKGAVGFLESLGALGMRLYLASGTDQEDVVQEAGRLGYAGCFDGGIYGSVGDITKFSKKKLISGIISEHGLEGPELCTFGDGPVEIAETRRVGGLTVGIASDEVRGWGINLAKRDRLIKAGADIIVPDFTQGQALLDYLQGKL
ncbi:MAG: hypothetical protein A3F83_04700 [Candidatus Glassbacteria bacterium RIFCSPLOWO2_12_FULL_58_11]|uniref:Carbohydrate kinase PfkB domain-containing protein n=1 Tax=Candidatus Glassbacteria bacterium RIFCSPLOWO2_12_FULL_58_11 TaxID=1817867 RepID=A0A1F5YP88_9BACT|nr:MAG: hypothetical protein A3F83_04700 [Candidatus Glassbacteria bacterium RIFCSPLOWO2_12_FULL_58_11]